MSQPDDASYQLPPYAAAPSPPTSPPARGGTASFVAASFAVAIVVLLFVEFLVQAVAIASTDFASYGDASLWILGVGLLLGVGAVVAGAIGVASRRRVVLGGVALGIGAGELMGVFWSIVTFFVHAIQSAF